MACKNICVHSAIEIQEDTLGFLYPNINKTNCIHCGLCYKVCPQLSRRPFSYPLKCYAAISKNEIDQLTCASGGIATVIGRHILNEGGVVVGCEGIEITHVQHRIITSIEELDHIKGSKYVQSRVSGKLYNEIKEKLILGKKVLFIGTGCQVAGLQNFLIRNYPNLITVDLVCHGVPSQKMLNDDLALYTKYKLFNINFRKKVINKIHFGISAMQRCRNNNDSKSFWIPWYKDPYLACFMSGISFRDGCYKCLYARPERQSDITLCDFWGLGKDSSLYGKPGVNAILINTRKGKELIEAINDNIEYEERDIKEAIDGNSQLRNPSEKNLYREIFIQLYQKNGIKTAYKETIFFQMYKKHLKTVLIPILYPVYKIFKKIFRFK